MLKTILFDPDFKTISLLFYPAIITQFIFTTYIAYKFYTSIIHEIRGIKSKTTLDYVKNINKILSVISILYFLLFIIDFTLFLIDTKSGYQLGHLPYFVYFLTLTTSTVMVKVLIKIISKKSNIGIKTIYAKNIKRNSLNFMILIIIAFIFSISLSNTIIYNQLDYSVDSTNIYRMSVSYFDPDNYDIENTSIIYNDTYKTEFIDKLGTIDSLPSIKSALVIYTFNTLFSIDEFSTETSISIVNNTELISFEENEMFSNDSIYINDIFVNQIDFKENISISLLDNSYKVKSDQVKTTSSMNTNYILSNIVTSFDFIYSLGINSENIVLLTNQFDIYLKPSVSTTSEKLTEVISTNLNISRSNFQIYKIGNYSYTITYLQITIIQIILGLILAFITIELFLLDDNFNKTLELLQTKYNIISIIEINKKMLILFLIGSSLIFSFLGSIVSIVRKPLFSYNYSISDHDKILSIIISSISIQLIQLILVWLYYYFNRPTKILKNI